jgi:hypothetical protein
MQINYDFHDDLTPEKVNVLFQMYREGLAPTDIGKDEK